MLMELDLMQVNLTDDTLRMLVRHLQTLPLRRAVQVSKNYVTEAKQYNDEPSRSRLDLRVAP